MFSFVRKDLAFLQENSRWIGAGFLLTLFSSFGQTFFIGLSGNELRTTFGLSGGEFGVLYMAGTLGSAITLPWLGRTLDLMRGWKVVLFTMPALAFACILITVAPNAVMLTLSIYLLRLFGQGVMTEIAFTETGRWFVANRGRAMALITQGFQLGTAVLPIVVVVIVQATDNWRTGWYASAAVILLVGLPILIKLMRVERIPRSHEATAVGHSIARDWTRSEVLRDPILYILLAGTLAPGFIGTVIFFHQSYLVELRGYAPLVFAVAYPLMSIATVVFGLICGYMIDKFGALRLLPFFLIPLAAASLGVGLITPVWGVYVFMLLLGVSNGFTTTMLGALWPEVYGLANLGGIRAITVSAMVLSTAIGPGITGALIDFGIPLPTQMLWMAGWCVFACVLLAYAARRVQKRNTPVEVYAAQ